MNLTDLLKQHKYLLRDMIYDIDREVKKNEENDNRAANVELIDYWLYLKKADKELASILNKTEKEINHE